MIDADGMGRRRQAGPTVEVKEIGTDTRMSEAATARIGDDRYSIPPDRPFVFGRNGAGDVVGLDDTDMGISRFAGSVRFDYGFWWVVNLSAKRHLLLDDGPGEVPQRLRCGRRHAINVACLTILVPGLNYTHRIEVIVPATELARIEPAGASSGTLVADDIRLSDRDRDVLIATYHRYLLPFPYRARVPLSYQEASDLLGPPWTDTRLRKQIDRFKARLARLGLYFDGPQAKPQLGEYLVDNAILGPADLERLPSGTFGVAHHKEREP